MGPLDAEMNKASPQAISGRRSLLSAVWKQGPTRLADGENVIAEIKESIQGMVDVKTEEEELDKVFAELAK